MKLEHFLFTFCMNCNAKRSSANIFPLAAHYVKEPHVAREPRYGHPCYIDWFYIQYGFQPLMDW